ncbi:hypothetical protein ACROYT_G015557 [Oculina patagonica]
MTPPDKDTETAIRNWTGEQSVKSDRPQHASKDHTTSKRNSSTDAGKTNERCGSSCTLKREGGKRYMWSEWKAIACAENFGTENGGPELEQDAILRLLRQQETCEVVAIRPVQCGNESQGGCILSKKLQALGQKYANAFSQDKSAIPEDRMLVAQSLPRPTLGPEVRQVSGKKKERLAIKCQED